MIVISSHSGTNRISIQCMKDSTVVTNVSAKHTPVVCPPKIIYYPCTR